MSVTSTAAGSAFPPSVAALMPRARALAARLGTMPSQNHIRRELHVGPTKAKAVLTELSRLRVVPDGPETDGPIPPPDSDTSVPMERETARVLATATTPAPADAEPAVTVAAPPESASESADPVALAAYGATHSGAFGHAFDPVPVTDADRPVPESADEHTAEESSAQATPVAVPVTSADEAGKPMRAWPLLLLTLPAFVAIWSGWVGLGAMTGFGTVHPLPGIWDHLTLNSAITLPIGMEVYAAFALRVWVSGRVPERARSFAKKSVIGALTLGAAGQVAYHLMNAAGVTTAPWWITTIVASLPVAVLGMGAALAHLIRGK